MELMGKLSYGIEILMAELVFLLCFPRRKLFALRFLATCGITLCCSYINFVYLHANPWCTFVGMLITICGSVIGQWLAFRKKAHVILAACVAGLAVQHISHHLYQLLLKITWIAPYRGVPLELAFTAAVCAGVWLVFARRLSEKTYSEDYNKYTVAMALIIVMICIGITRFVRPVSRASLSATIGIAAYAITCCTLALFVEFSIQAMVKLRTENLMLQRISEEERKRYEVSRENAEMMNIKYHDFKHKLMAIKEKLPEKEIASTQELISQYDSMYYTGLDSLDIVLNEKNLRCQAKQIAMTVLGNGAELCFMDSMDVYSLFGNVLDNAIEAVEGLTPTGRRSISLIIERKGEFVYINCMNFLDHHLQLQENGLPNTTKSDGLGYHGYGLRSVRLIAEKYHGGISITTESGVFGLSVYMMAG